MLMGLPHLIPSNPPNSPGPKVRDQVTCAPRAVPTNALCGGWKTDAVVFQVDRHEGKGMRVGVGVSPLAGAEPVLLVLRPGEGPLAPRCL